MKFLFPIFLVTISLISCQKEKCFVEEGLVAPETLTVTKVGTLSDVEDVYQLQFISEDIGFILAAKEGDTVEILKTTDSGSSWESINPPAETYPNDLFFLNESIGFLTQYDDNDFPNLLKTINGGETWVLLSFPEFTGRMGSFKVGQDDRVYAEISAIGEPTYLVRSVDEGESWQTVYTLPSLTLQTYQVDGDHIYMVTTDREIIYTDLDGGDEQVVKIDHINNSTVDFEIIDQDTWVLTSYYSAVKTIDRGETWNQIYDDASRIVGFEDANKGIMVLYSGYCGDSPIDRGVLATTTSGGLSWKESVDTEYLVDRFTMSCKTGEAGYMILLEDWSSDRFEVYLVE